MRALVLILCCVVLIALVQASYIHVSKDSQDEDRATKVHGHHHVSGNHGNHVHANHHREVDLHHEHHVPTQGHKDIRTMFDSHAHDERDEQLHTGHFYGQSGHGRGLSHHKDQTSERHSLETDGTHSNDIKLPDDDKKSLSENRRGKKHHFINTDANRHTYQDSEDVTLGMTSSSVNDIKKNDTRRIRNKMQKLRVRIERIEDSLSVPAHDTIREHLSKASNFGRKYVNRHFNKSVSSGTTLFSKEGRSRIAERRRNAHQYGGLNKKGKRNKQINANNSIPHTKPSCKTDADCVDGCCIQLKNGKSRCKLAQTRPEGHKCESSCVCSAGLQCFVDTYKRNGHKKVLHDGKRILGHCVNKNRTAMSNGYYLPKYVRSIP